MIFRTVTTPLGRRAFVKLNFCRNEITTSRWRFSLLLSIITYEPLYVECTMFPQSHSTEARTLQLPAEALQDRDAASGTQLHLRALPNPRWGPSHGQYATPARVGPRAQPGHSQPAHCLTGTWSHSLPGTVTIVIVLCLKWEEQVCAWLHTLNCRARRLVPAPGMWHHSHRAVTQPTGSCKTPTGYQDEDITFFNSSSKVSGQSCKRTPHKQIQGKSKGHSKLSRQSCSTPHKHKSRGIWWSRTSGRSCSTASARQVCRECCRIARN
jgi:hypothetical protein